MSRINLKTATFAVAALFFALGFNYGSWASRLPAIKSQLDLGAAEVGFLLLAAGPGWPCRWSCRLWPLLPIMRLRWP